ncbi:snare protein syntaxin 18/UFE1 [Thelephora terrestris]|uniref:Snare protein syntaxin 18/UFE1 n=1 Tax=Thelephora terrestris TaxID=56493 RepID=A0A9P6HB73_9AGAM|nr:snare protein syntaxin 18/UFE1 [Thelephora terrestris]
MSINRTSEFRKMLANKKASTPEPHRKRAPKADPGKEVFNKEYLKEGYAVLHHIASLTRMLSHIRKPYLNMDMRPHASRQPTRTLDLGSSEDFLLNVRYLTNEERDQIDLQARLILTKCSDRVKQMEALETRRVELVGSKVNPLAKFLPARLLPGSEATLASDFVAAHHASITWYLNRRLAEASQAQKEMQEERVKRQLERTHTLGSGAAKEAVLMGHQSSIPVSVSGTDHAQSSTPGSWLGTASSNLASSLAATIGVNPNRNEARPSYATMPVEDIEDDDEDEYELSASQIMQFEDENAAILRNVQDTLAAVQQAESSLLEISQLQTELIAHLTHQTELTDQLFEDAITTTSTMDKGNEQLREAKRRGKDSRLYILVFLIGASLSLLFLHYY